MPFRSLATRRVQLALTGGNLPHPYRLIVADSGDQRSVQGEGAVLHPAGVVGEYSVGGAVVDIPQARGAVAAGGRVRRQARRAQFDAS